MKEIKVLKRRRPAGIVPKRRSGRKPTRSVAKGDVIIPKKGMWAGEECLVLDVEKRPQPYGYCQIVHVLLPNQRQRCYPLTEIKEIIPGKGAIVTKPRQQESDAKVPNEKSNMKVVMKHVSGSAKGYLKHAKTELSRVLAFRGDVVSVKAEGDKITLAIEINPKWEYEDKVAYLKEWIPAKVKSVFEVISVSK